MRTQKQADDIAAACADFASSRAAVGLAELRVRGLQPESLLAVGQPREGFLRRLSQGAAGAPAGAAEHAASPLAAFDRARRGGAAGGGCEPAAAFARALLDAAGPLALTHAVDLSGQPKFGGADGGAGDGAAFGGLWDGFLRWADPSPWAQTQGALDDGSAGDSGGSGGSGGGGEQEDEPMTPMAPTLPADALVNPAAAGCGHGSGTEGNAPSADDGAHVRRSRRPKAARRMDACFAGDADVNWAVGALRAGVPAAPKSPGLAPRRVVAHHHLAPLQTMPRAPPAHGGGHTREVEEGAAGGNATADAHMADSHGEGALRAVEALLKRVSAGGGGSDSDATAEHAVEGLLRLRCDTPPASPLSVGAGRAASPFAAGGRPRSAGAAFGRRHYRVRSPDPAGIAARAVAAATAAAAARARSSGEDGGGPLFRDDTAGRRSRSVSPGASCAGDSRPSAPSALATLRTSAAVNSAPTAAAAAGPGTPVLAVALPPQASPVVALTRFGTEHRGIDGWPRVAPLPLELRRDFAWAGDAGGGAGGGGGGAPSPSPLGRGRPETARVAIRRIGDGCGDDSSDEDYVPGLESEGGHGGGGGGRPRSAHTPRGHAGGARAGELASPAAHAGARPASAAGHRRGGRKPARRAAGRELKASAKGPCANCGVDKSVLWRCHPVDASIRLCNACGIYRRSTGRDRPLSAALRGGGGGGGGGGSGARAAATGKGRGQQPPAVGHRAQLAEEGETPEEEEPAEALLALPLQPAPVPPRPQQQSIMAAGIVPALAGRVGVPAIAGLPMMAPIRVAAVTAAAQQPARPVAPQPLPVQAQHAAQLQQALLLQALQGQQLLAADGAATPLLHAIQGLLLQAVAAQQQRQSQQARPPPPLQLPQQGQASGGAQQGAALSPSRKRRNDGDAGAAGAF